MVCACRALTLTLIGPPDLSHAGAHCVQHTACTLHAHALTGYLFITPRCTRRDWLPSSHPQVHTPWLVQLVARLGRGEACGGAEDCLRAARELRWPEAVLRATRGLKSFSEYDCTF